MEFTSWNPKELYHFGTKGMKWGQRRFQNEDGSLTSLGKERYGKNGYRGAIGRAMDLNKLDRERTSALSRATRLNARAERRTARARKKMENAKDSETAEKYKKKIEKIKSGIGQKAKDYKALAGKSKKLADKIVANSLKKGMSVKTNSVLRTSWMDEGQAGKHYRVKNDGRGNRISNVKSYNQLKAERDANAKRYRNYTALMAVKNGRMDLDTYIRRKRVGYY